MQKAEPRPYFPDTGRAALLSCIFHDWQLKLYLLLLTFLLTLLFSSSASAAVDGFVARCDEGGYHQYCYNELLDSYALKIKGHQDGLYDDFAAKSPFALYAGSSLYIDYRAVLDHYAATLINGTSFSLEHYLQNGKASPAKMPGQIFIVSMVSGKLVREELNLDLGEDKEETDNNDQDKDLKTEMDPEIVGPAKIKLESASKWAMEKNAHQRFVDIATLYWEYGEKSGIRPEVLFAQAAHETGFGHYNGIVPPEYNNWAGIKTASASGNEPEDHEQFDTPEDGVRAHFNHISAYVGLEPIGEPHGRYHVVVRLSWAGTVEKIKDLSGKWAPSSTYHVRIVNMLQEMQQ